MPSRRALVTPRSMAFSTPSRYVRHRRHVFVALLKRRLVHAQEPRRRCRAAALQAPPHRPLHHTVHLVPTQIQEPGHRRHARRAQPVDHHRLEQRRRTGTSIPPRHTDRVHPVFRAAHPRHLRPQDRPVLARRQMTPTTATSVVRPRIPAARRTAERLHAANKPRTPRPRQPHVATQRQRPPMDFTLGSLKVCSGV